MKQLNSFAVISVGGGDRISFTYDEIDDQTGEPVGTNNKQNFYVVDNDLKTSVEEIKAYIREHKLGE